MSGKITVDVKQYRIRGRFGMDCDDGGNLTFEFNSSAALGGLREDVVISCYEDTMRVFDRERLSYYEGGQVDSLITRATGLDLDVAGFVGLVTGHVPGCDGFESAAVSTAGDGWQMYGTFRGGDFKAEFEGGRMVKASWPALVDGRVRDRIVVTYRWKRPGEDGIFLDELVIFLEGRRWRVKLQAD